MTHPPNFLKDSNASPKVKTMEEVGVEGLSSQHFWGKRGVLEL
jgi:hypothetical protein